MVDGHRNDIECLVTNEAGNIVASSCLEGIIKTWDSYSGEQLATIDRQR